MSELRQYNKSNKLVQSLYDLPVGGSLEFENETTNTPKGAYKQLHRHLTYDGQPFEFQARTIGNKLVIIKTKDNRS